MIEPMISENGQSRARCVCDECGAVQVIAVHFERHRGGASVRRVNEGAAHKKLSHLGWVARIREELFGPDTRNQEVEALRKDLGKLADDIQAHQAELRGAREAVKVVEKKVSAFMTGCGAATWTG